MQGIFFNAKYLLFEISVYLNVLANYSVPFRWNEAKNTLLLRELYSSEPFLYKVGSKEAGQKWTEVAEKLNCYSLFRDMPRDQRSVREQFNKLLKDYKNKKNKEERASGINPDPPTENEVLLEEIAEAMESTPIRVENANSKKDDKKRKEALACRDKAMTTWAKAGASGDVSDSEHDVDSDTEKKTVKRRGRKRRASSDPFQYLAEKTAKETDLRKEELELKRQQLQLQAEQQKEQFKLQQEQMKQVMQSQMNTQNLIIALVQKLGTK